MTTEKNILIVHGPNLNLLGQREPDIYGVNSLEEIDQELIELADQIGLQVECKQSNHEGAIIEWLHEALINDIDGIIINPAAYTHTSVAIADALSAIQIPTIEVHLSNIYAREEFRHKSLIAPYVIGQISGLGINSYLLALIALSRL